MSIENPFETPLERTQVDGDEERILYSDKFVTLSTKTLKVEGFHFSLSNRVKTIALSEILHWQRANGDNLGNKKIEMMAVAAWGISFTGIYWAIDLSRMTAVVFPSRKKMANSIVLNRLGMYGLVGFSVERIGEFEAQLQEALKSRNPASVVHSP